MIGQRVSHHKILEVFREGDLGIVYLVQEPNLISSIGSNYPRAARCTRILVVRAMR